MKNIFMNKMRVCPVNTHFCGYSEGQTCIVFTKEQMMEPSKVFDCEKELKKINRKPRGLKDVSLGLFD